MLLWCGGFPSGDGFGFCGLLMMMCKGWMKVLLIEVGDAAPRDFPNAFLLYEES